jgi:hypothetical protein
MKKVVGCHHPNLLDLFQFGDSGIADYLNGGYLEEANKTL